MKKLTYILPFILIGCSSLYIKNNSDYPKNFIISEKADSNNLVYYFDETGEYYIYHKKDKKETGDTLNIKPVFFNKYLKVK